MEWECLLAVERVGNTQRLLVALSETLPPRLQDGTSCFSPGSVPPTGRRLRLELWLSALTPPPVHAPGSEDNFHKCKDGFPCMQSSSDAFSKVTWCDQLEPFRLGSGSTLLDIHLYANACLKWRKKYRFKIKNKQQQQLRPELFVMDNMGCYSSCSECTERSEWVTEPSQRGLHVPKRKGLDQCKTKNNIISKYKTHLTWTSSCFLSSYLVNVRMEAKQAKAFSLHLSSRCILS